MEAQEIKDAVAQGMAAAFEAQKQAEANAAKAKQEADEEKAARQAEIDAAVEAALKVRLEPSKMQHEAGGEKPKADGYIVGSKYDRLDDVELDVLACYMGKSKNGWSERLRNALVARKGAKALVYTGPTDFPEGIKAVDAMDLTDTANWVPTAWADELLHKTRLDNKIASLFRNIDLPANTYEMPRESTSPTVYKVGEWTGTGTPALSAGVTASLAVDAKITFSTSKLGAAVWLSGELEEDSAFPLIPEVRNQMGKEMGNAVEYVLLNGDTTTGSSNISVASPAATDKVLLDDGLRHYCLVTATGQKQDCGALDFDDLVAIRGKLGKEGVNPSGLAWIADVDTYLAALLKIDEFITVDKYGMAGATVLKGELGKILGSPLIVSENLYKTATTGLTIAAGSTGNLLCVSRDQWYVGWRRHFKFWQEYYGMLDATILTVMCRMCFVGFNETDGTAVALGYNITV